MEDISSSAPAPTSDTAPTAPAPASTPAQPVAPKQSPTESLLAKRAASKQAEQTPASQPNTTPASTSEPATAPSVSKQEAPKEKWSGNFADLDGLPPEVQEKAKGIQRYLTEQQQKNAEALKKAQAFDSYVNSPDYQAYQQWKAAQPAQPTVDVSGVQVPTDLAEQALTDPQALLTLINKVADEKAAEVKHQQAIAEREAQINEFAASHSDFWDVYDQLGPLIKDQLQQGKNIEQAYLHVKGIQQSFADAALQESQGRIQEKKAAITSTPSVRTESDVVWVDSQADSYRVSRELAEKGISKRVMIRRPVRK